VRILVVEDDASVRGWLFAVLTRNGHHVQAARSAGEAAAFVLFDIPQTPDLALLDMLLPDTTGVAFAPTLRSHFPEIRFVFMTGWLDTETHEFQARKYGPVLRKPFSPDRLFETIGAPYQRPP
jgi:DNA-binding response OmpR family regulator